MSLKDLLTYLTKEKEEKTKRKTDVESNQVFLAQASENQRLSVQSKQTKQTFSDGETNHLLQATVGSSSSTNNEAYERNIWLRSMRAGQGGPKISHCLMPDNRIKCARKTSRIIDKLF